MATHSASFAAESFSLLPDSASHIIGAGDLVNGVDYGIVRHLKVGMLASLIVPL